ncbi:hypothetical protein HYPSUDRAFT_884936 [Hypholoma sublateritium FD-334 SS-4]|uniref:DUF6533 domain-containing protein n=1 Tax=Hypholoma sublateritium (strain FD-334 SS-4) TaxID=945553 RepID=A0A0D2Q841_HYPSF|nr:hypothetical protein HYPSUDRAFT_884936 [Hypholoma sublateritium FD-334 SS-4]
MSPLLGHRQTDGQPLFSPFSSKDVAAGAQAVNRSSVAALAFLVWDILITTDDEIKYIWPRSWTYTKFVYFFVRYVPMLVQIPLLLVGSELSPHFHFTPHDCFAWGVYQGVAAAVVVVVVDSILILRVHALYHGNIMMPRVLAFFYALEITGLAVGLGLALPGITYDNVCVVKGVPGTLIIYGAASVLFQFLLFGLTLHKFIQAARSGWGDVPLILLLVRDGTWAFFLLFFIYVAQLSLYALKNHAFSGVFYSWLLTAFSFSGYRILINLSRFGERTNPRSVQRHSTRRTDTNIQFTTNIRSAGRSTDQSESYELSSSSRGGRTFDTSQISTLSLGK